MVRHLKRINNDGSKPRSSDVQAKSPVKARDRYFCTTELVEETLLHLPLQDITAAQRVSKSFQAVIKGSVKIQRAIFFVPPVKPLRPVRRLPPLIWQGVFEDTQAHKHGMIVTLIESIAAPLIKRTTLCALFGALTRGQPWMNFSIYPTQVVQLWYKSVLGEELCLIDNAKGITCGDVFHAVKQKLPSLDRARCSGPRKRRCGLLTRQLPAEVTGWETTVLLEEILKGTY